MASIELLFINESVPDRASVWFISEIPEGNVLSSISDLTFHLPIKNCQVKVEK